MNNRQMCLRCVLTADIPGVSIGADGICDQCHQYASNRPNWSSIRSSVEIQIRNLIGRSQNYDIVMAYSGGKDSTYALQYLRNTFEARIVAITIDNSFMSSVAYENCRIVSAMLGVDHIIFKPNPKAMSEIYNESFKKRLHSPSTLARTNAICASCIQVINSQILNFATFYDIPVVAGGYLGGQVPSQRGLMEQNLKVTSMAREQFESTVSKEFSPETSRLFTQAIGIRERFHIFNPMVYLNVPEKEIVNTITRLGWKQPEDTGSTSTNCLLNEYAIHRHQREFGYHPNAHEMSNSIRNGTLDREEALRKIENLSTNSFQTVNQRLVELQ